jgi:hypothetical protein
MRIRLAAPRRGAIPSRSGSQHSVRLATPATKTCAGDPVAADSMLGYYRWLPLGAVPLLYCNRRMPIQGRASGLGRPYPASRTRRM